MMPWGTGAKERTAKRAKKKTDEVEQTGESRSGRRTLAAIERLPARAAGAAGPAGAAFRRVVADVFGRHHEDDVFRDVRRMIADALQVAGNENQIERRLDGRGILQHVGEELPEDLRFQ